MGFATEPDAATEIMKRQTARTEEALLNIFNPRYPDTIRPQWT
jgi:hypothetical protein